jgi:hypothetical protein
MKVSGFRAARPRPGDKTGARQAFDAPLDGSPEMAARYCHACQNGWS